MEGQSSDSKDSDSDPISTPTDDVRKDQSDEGDGVPDPIAQQLDPLKDHRLLSISKVRTQQDTMEKCPRCDSSDTKFCYYNNYSLTQPRYFCKTCRRYWTEAGSLRNVPVGGGCRKNKRSTHISSTVVTNSTVPKFKAADDMGIRASSHLTGGSGFDPRDLTSGPVPWAPPRSSIINPINPLNPNRKEVFNIFGTSHGIGTSLGLGFGLDSLVGQLPNSMGLCGSFPRNNGNLNHHQMAIQQNHGDHPMAEDLWGSCSNFLSSTSSSLLLSHSSSKPPATEVGGRSQQGEGAGLDVMMADRGDGDSDGDESDGD